jgi:hypothetical protein
MKLVALSSLHKDRRRESDAAASVHLVKLGIMNLEQEQLNSLNHSYLSRWHALFDLFNSIQRPGNLHLIGLFASSFPFLPI